jgi:hypothetical protein
MIPLCKYLLKQIDCIQGRVDFFLYPEPNKQKILAQNIKAAFWKLPWCFKI